MIGGSERHHPKCQRAALYEHTNFQEAPRSFQMAGVDTELCRLFNYNVCVFMDLVFESCN